MAGARLFSMPVLLSMLLAGCTSENTVPMVPGQPDDLVQGCDRANLSPATWTADELAALPLSPQSQSIGPHSNSSKTGMIVGITSPFAVHAGLKVLENCGNALDAALAAGFAQITLAVGSWISFAGISTILYYDSATGAVTHVGAGWNAMLDPSAPPNYSGLAVPSGRSVLVHGFMDGAGEAHERWGVLPWDSLFDASIWIAEQGMTLDRGFATIMAARYPNLLRTPEGREIFLKPDGTPYREGDTFRQPQLAKTLHGVAEQGHRYLYSGAWGEKWVSLINREGGAASMVDLDNYAARVEEPVRGEARGLTVFGPTPPQGGAEAMVTALRDLEKKDMRSMGTPYTSSEALFTELRAWSDVGDLRPRFPSAHTDGVVAVDSQGNVAAMIHTINAVVWGSTGIFVDGIALADAGSHQGARVEEAGPGGRIPNECTPTIVVDATGQPVMASAGAGSSLEEVTFQRLVDFVEYGQALGDAVHNPSFQLYNSAIYGDFDEAVLMGVRARGEPIPEVPEQGDALRGFFVGVQIDRANGTLIGAHDGVGPGTAQGMA